MFEIEPLPDTSLIDSEACSRSNLTTEQSSVIENMDLDESVEMKFDLEYPNLEGDNWGPLNIN